jgi:ribose transport system permease protein
VNIAGSRFLSRYGMLAILLALCALFSILTLREQPAGGARAARALVPRLEAAGAAGGQAHRVLIVTRGGSEDARFASALAGRLRARGVTVAGTMSGDPQAIRQGIEGLAASGAMTTPFDAIATLEACAPIVRDILAGFPALASTPIVTPPPRRWPTFLLSENLRNVANQIAVIAIIAIGMTMVIISGGIDLSVGSLIALAAVVSTGLIGKLGGEGAPGGAMLIASLAAIALCGATGAFSGLVITRFQVPPFIATLGIMQVASGIAYILSQGKPIYRVPEGFIALGRGVDPLLGIPYAVIVMLALYAIAHLVMARTTLGRYVYAVGGNAEAARLAGVRVSAVLLLVYTVCAILAGLGGVIMASQLKSGAPTYGLMYELYVIAAVVVGGTSLSGGEGRIFGTLIGAFIIAVIQNGMNLTNVESYTQKVVLGLVILGAVLLDRLKHRGWFWQRRRGRVADKET